MRSPLRHGGSSGGPPDDRLPCLIEGLEVSPAPECFAHNCYWDPTFHSEAAKLLPGEYFVATRDMLLVTVLGSCVSACIRDTRTGAGGMNHFMLPDSDLSDATGKAARYGVYAMELLLGHLLKIGARRERLEAKVFGGGAVLPGMTLSNIGERNSEFVLDFLATEKINVVANDLNGPYPRKVYFFPHSGRVMIKRLRTVANSTLLERENDYRRRLVQASVDGGDIELFD